MSSSFNVYVGPLLIVNAFHEHLKLTIRACSNDGCAKHQRPVTGKYCKECGHPIGDVEVANTHRLALGKIWEMCPTFRAEEFDDHLYNDDGPFLYLTPSHPEKCGGIFASDPGFTQLNRVMHEQAGLDFRASYEQEIKALKTSGLTFAIGYGVVRYWS